MAQFDPSEKDVQETLDYLAKAGRAERARVLAAEVDGKGRKTVLEKYGIDPDARYGATGRPLYPWEAVGEQKVDFGREEPEEDEEVKAVREASLAQEEKAAAASEQLGSSAAGSGVAPAAQAAGSSTSAGSTGSTSAGASTPASGATGFSPA